MDLSYILNQLGEESEFENGLSAPVVPPIVQSANFRFKDVAAFRKSIQDEFNLPLYTRGANPTVKILRQKMAALEGTEEAMVVSSGSSASALAVLSQVKTGDHVICVQRPYSWTKKLVGTMLPRFGVESTFIDGTQIENFERAIRPTTKLIFLESPNSWTYEIQNLREVTALAKKHGIRTLIDNSCATPLNQRPADYGVDIVIHSSSKYIGGHSDAVSGVICSSTKIMREIFFGPYMTLGAAVSPHDAWLLIRGLRTLELRVARAAESTPKVVEFMETHPKVERVLYTHSKSFPQYELARKQIKRGGGLFTVVFKAKTVAEMDKLCSNFKRFQLAASWGGYESLVIPACAMMTEETKNNFDLPFNMVRFYVGIEDPAALIEDLRQGLA